MTTDVIIKILQNQSTNGIVEITDVLAKEIIQKLENYKITKNELCLLCGKYKNEHLGACKDCRWHDE